jgi:plasmid replication initiation protein
VDIAISDLHEELDVPESLRKDFAGFRRRVLEQAHKDITIREKSSLWFDWEPIKSGRNGKVIAIHFVLNPLQARELKKNQKPEVQGENFVVAQLQKQSNSCFERLHSKKQKCEPDLKKTKCQFCTTRGRMYAVQYLDQNQGTLPFDG